MFDTLNDGFRREKMSLRHAIEPPMMPQQHYG